jgi:hypothetical protein
MKVEIKSFDVQMEVKNNGIEFEVADNEGNHQGDVILTKTGLIWCKGRQRRANGTKISWTKFIEIMGTQN